MDENGDPKAWFSQEAVRSITEASMRAVNRRILAFILTGVISLFSTASHGSEREDATAVAQAVMAALVERNFGLIWDTLASDAYKKTAASRENSIIVFTYQRQQIGGRLTRSNVLDAIYMPPRPNLGVNGKGYTIVFQNFYSTGPLFEFVALIEENGQFKMLGAWADPSARSYP